MSNCYLFFSDEKNLLSDVQRFILTRGASLDKCAQHLGFDKSKIKVEFFSDSKKNLEIYPSFKLKIQQINFNILNYIIKKHNLKGDKINEKDLFDKKIFKKSKGKLKLLNVGSLEKPLNIEISFASKKAIEIVEKVGGKVNLIKD